MAVLAALLGLLLAGILIVLLRHRRHTARHRGSAAFPDGSDKEDEPKQGGLPYNFGNVHTPVTPTPAYNNLSLSPMALPQSPSSLQPDSPVIQSAASDTPMLFSQSTPAQEYAAQAISRHGSSQAGDESQRSPTPPMSMYAGELPILMCTLLPAFPVLFSSRTTTRHRS